MHVVEVTPHLATVCTSLPLECLGHIVRELEGQVCCIVVSSVCCKHYITNDSVSAVWFLHDIDMTHIDVGVIQCLVVST